MAGDGEELAAIAPRAACGTHTFIAASRVPGYPLALNPQPIKPRRRPISRSVLKRA